MHQCYACGTLEKSQGASSKEVRSALSICFRGQSPLIIVKTDVLSPLSSTLHSLLVWLVLCISLLSVCVCVLVCALSAFALRALSALPTRSRALLRLFALLLSSPLSLCALLSMLYDLLEMSALLDPLFLGFVICARFDDALSHCSNCLL